VNNTKHRTRARWLAAIVVLLCLTLLGAQISFTQEPSQEFGLGDIRMDPETYQKHLKVFPVDMVEGLPAAYDARDDGIVTPAKNQGQCGSCWAFANVGSMESHLLKDYGFGPTNLSEQQLVSCELGSFGCCGGYASSARYWEDDGPIYESCFSYAESGTSCSQAQRTVACSESASCEQIPYRVEVGSWHSVQATTTGFKTSLYNEGPGYWRFDVYTDFDVYWSTADPGDVYVSQFGHDLRGGHAVLLIGWDDAKGAYLCKNSWGGGGPNNDGTFWIAYTGHYYNLYFGMYNFSVIPLGCSSHADCDDGIFCNGAETCVDSVCQDGTPPDCPDDGLFCNGSEFCDEAIDDCNSTGDPCTPPLMCDEVNDTCVECLVNADCDDSEPCTDDLCTAGQCSNTWFACGLEDGCCGPACTWPDDPDCACGNGVCDEGEDCNTCSVDCISGSGGSCEACFKGVCNGECHPKKEGPDCADCAPSYCCGDGVCEGEEDNTNCAIDCGAPPVCPDGNCDAGEDPCSCPEDCGIPPETEVDCTDGLDNDCDDLTDCGDSDCSDDPACTAPTMFVFDITMSGKTAGPNRSATAVVTIHDTDGTPVEGATVHGSWSGDYSGDVSGVTGPDGTVSFTSGKVRQANAYFKFTPTDVVKTNYTYEPSLNNVDFAEITVP
jgi:hypothetical protein